MPEVGLEPYARAAESVIGLVSIPVSVARLAVSLGAYELSEDGDVVETARTEEDVVVPLAHTEGGLTASVQRGAKAIAESGGSRTYVIADRITRASCFMCKDTGDALTLARWIEGEVPALRSSCAMPTIRSCPATRSCGRRRRTSSARCATSSGASPPVTRSART